MSDKELDLILKQIDSTKESLSRELHGGLKGVRHYVDANGEVLSSKIDALNEKVTHLNGNLSNHEIEIKKNVDNIKDLTGKEERIRKRNKRLIKLWWLWLIIIYSMFWSAAYLYHHINFRKTIERVTGITIEEEAVRGGTINND